MKPETIIALIIIIIIIAHIAFKCSLPEDKGYLIKLKKAYTNPYYVHEKSKHFSIDEKSGFLVGFARDGCTELAVPVMQCERRHAWNYRFVAVCKHKKCL